MPYVKNSTQKVCLFASGLRKTQFLKAKQEKNVESDHSE